MQKSLPSIKTWFIATAITFFSRAFLYSMWFSRGPEIKAALGLETAGLGYFVMLYPLGGLVGVLFASRLQNRFGSRRLTTASFTISSLSMAGLAFSVTTGNLWLSCALLFIMGLPMSITDFVQNFQATAINARSSRSLIAAIHSSFGVGLMLGALVSNFFISGNVSLLFGFLAAALVVFIPSVLSARIFPADALIQTEPSPAANSAVDNNNPSSGNRISRTEWLDKRTIIVAFVGLTFIVSEVSAATWIPIALVKSGVSTSEAATALSGFWLIVTLVRAFGGFLIDRIGRAAASLLSAVFTAAGALIFALTPQLHLPYLGMAAWSAGMALGFPMAVNGMGDDPAKAAARLNMIIAVVYFAGLIVGPLLGSLGQIFGIFPAFLAPIVLSLVAATQFKKLKPVAQA